MMTRRAQPGSRGPFAGPSLRAEAVASPAAIDGDRAIDEAASGACVLAGAVPRAGPWTRGDAGRRLARATPSRARRARRIKAYFGRTARRIAAGYVRVGGRARCIGIAVRRRFARLCGVVEAVGGCRLVARRVLLGARRGGAVSRGCRVAALSAAGEKAERGERGHDSVESTEGGKGPAPVIHRPASTHVRCQQWLPGKPPRSLSAMAHNGAASTIRRS
jgi:hypothetical protein